MADRNFREMLEKQWADGKFVCVGLDSDYNKIPESAIKPTVYETILKFNVAIIQATADLVCAYKPNIAFYAGQGLDGIKALIATITYIMQYAPRVPVILDAKVGDIENTNKGYVRFVFGVLKADAVTVYPYLGKTAMQPFLDEKDKGIIVICKTSNKDSDEFQNLQINGVPLYKIVAKHIAARWNENNNCAVVVGATYPAELQEVRGIVNDMPILIPGIGKQGGDLEKTVQVGASGLGTGMMINSSRGIIFASQKPDFAQTARQETGKLHNAINKLRKGV
ncbi:orotidine-5'-phosphate decarboxylase [Patescibacteria group bacterium]